MHPAVQKMLEVLPAYAGHFEARGWNSPSELHKEKPTIDFRSSSFAESLYGDDNWQRD